MACSALLLSSCGTSVYYVHPPDWSKQSKRDSTIAAFADVLKGKTIFLDPGHGGDDRSGIGPEEDVVEADVNLRVALRLREYLKSAGANVLMSRESDLSVPLPARVQQANANDAHVFLSIHHNAAPNNTTNYTSTFYHARPGAQGYKPSSHDLARYIQRDLAFVMGNPGPLASFDGTMTDFLIHPNDGFAVLRGAKMTSVLIECSFFTSAYEEQRLRLPEFNDIQAWGIFRGLGKYLRAGVPQITYASPSVFSERRPKIEIQVTDRTEIRDESIRIWIDGKEEGFIYNKKTNRITVTPSDDLAPGYHRLSAQVRNENENSSAPFELYFAVGTAPALLRSSVEPAVLPPDESAYAHISIAAVDSGGAPLGDGLPIRFTTSSGIDTLLFMRQGLVGMTLAPGTLPRVTFEASNGPVRTEGAVSTSRDALYTRGIVMSSGGKAVRNASIVLPGGKEARSNEAGEFIIAGVQTAGLEATVHATGFFARQEAFTGERVQDPVVLAPVARGTLHGKIVLLDVTGSSMAVSPQRVDSLAAICLSSLLQASGATVITPSKAVKTRKESAELFAAHKSAAYIQFGMHAGSGKMVLKINGHSGAKTLADILQKVMPAYSGIGFQPMVLRLPPQGEGEKLRQLTLSLPAAGKKSYDERLTALFAWNAAWAVYSSILTAEGFKPQGSKTIEVSVREKGSGNPATSTLVEVNGTLRGMTDAKGVVRFRNITAGEDNVRVLDAERYEIAGVKTEIVQ